MEVFEAFMKQLHGEGHLSKRTARVIAEDGAVSADLPWAL
jgi:hypothetical protein